MRRRINTGIAMGEKFLEAAIFISIHPYFHSLVEVVMDLNSLKSTLR